MRNEPRVPSAKVPLKRSLSPQFKRYAQNDARNHKAAATIMVAKADVLSVLKQQTDESKPNLIAAEASVHDTSVGERILVSSRRGSNPFRDKRQSVKFKLEQEHGGKESERNHENISQLLDHAQVLVRAAHSEMFDHKYQDYRDKVDEVNKAKTFLLANRDKMSEETKRRMVKHIKRKMMIIEMIEEEFEDMKDDD